MSPDLRAVAPEAVLGSVSRALPEDVRGNIVIIGSLAAAYQLLPRDRMSVRTKDVDCVLRPRISAVENGRAIAERLLAAGWTPAPNARFGARGSASTPLDELPAVRLHPPGSSDWFIELLTEPESEEQERREWARVALASGDHFGLPSFPTTGLTIHDAQPTPLGLRCARPEFMALSNLLEHRAFGDEPIADSDFQGRPQLRRNKDLGRVLAIALLSDPDSLEVWTERWREGLRTHFPSRWQSLARGAGAGLRRLLDSPDDLLESLWHCSNGLLSMRGCHLEELQTTGARLLRFAIEPLERMEV